MKTMIILAVVVLSLVLVGSFYGIEGSFDGDIDGDLDVDANDLSILTFYWLYGDCNEPDWCGGADLDRDHEVSFFDFAIQARDWKKRIRSIQSHSTHMEGVRGPGITCSDCHDKENFPYFNSGIDSNSDGKYDLDETDVCNECHSPGGAFNGVNTISDSVGAKDNWHTGVYTDGHALQAGKERWCLGCHDSNSSVVGGVSASNVGGDVAQTWGFFVNGHGRHLQECTDCHDTSVHHIDGRARTYSFDSAYYGPTQSGVAYAAGYRLRYVDGEVPLMIPANYNITFSYDAGLMKANAFRLCFDCHDASRVMDNVSSDGIWSNFKASLPDPPRNYSYAWGSGADINEHVAHIMNYIGPFADSDWDTGTEGPGSFLDGMDSMTACSSCHNVHGAAGTEDSSNEAMIRDGSLAGRTGYGFSYVREDIGGGGYPQVTSTGVTQATSVGAIFRNNTANMCAGSMCHDGPAPPAGSSYDATGSGWGTYLEYYRP